MHCCQVQSRMHEHLRASSITNQVLDSGVSPILAKKWKRHAKEGYIVQPQPE